MTTEEVRAMLYGEGSVPIVITHADLSVDNIRGFFDPIYDEFDPGLQAMVRAEHPRVQIYAADLTKPITQKVTKITVKDKQYLAHTAQPEDDILLVKIYASV